MSTDSIALFLHLAGALGIFMTLGLEWTGLGQIRSAVAPVQVRAWMGILKKARGVGFASMLTTVITGMYMVLSYFGGVPWVLVTMGALVLVIVLSVALTGPRMAAIGKALGAEKGAATEAVHTLANHPLLWISIQTRVAIALGIVFLKVAKPDLGGSLLTIAVAVLLGVASTLPIPRRERAQEGAGS